MVIFYQYSTLNNDLIDEYKSYLKQSLGLCYIKCTSIEELSGICAPIHEINENNEDDSWESIRDSFLIEAKRKIDNNNCTLFLGAGVSADANMKGWEKLLSELLKNAPKQSSAHITEQDLNSVKNKCYNSSIITARYIEALYGGRDWKKDLAEILYTGLTP